jgi:hypothetical protein
MPAAGIAGINNALVEQGLTITFSNILPGFFIAITLNDVSASDMHGFRYERLQDLRAVPLKTVPEYPFDATQAHPPFSLHLYSLENGDSLRLQFVSLPVNNRRFILKTETTGGGILIEELNENSFQDPEFGSRWIQEQALIVNNSAGNAVSAFNALASPKYYVGKLGYSSATNADLKILATGIIAANQFSAPYDSCILKSVVFNSPQSSGRVTIHVYLQPIQEGSNPSAITTNRANVLESEWTTINLENLQIRRDKGETFDLGIEFMDYGVLSYSRDPAEPNRSFLRRTTDPAFRLLSRAEIDGEALDGGWLIRMEYNAPRHNKPQQADDFKVPYTIDIIGPSPFPSPGNSALRIQYTLENPGLLKIEIFNILGELVRTVFNGYDHGPIGVRWWDGTNNNHHQVASGQYFLCFRFEGFMEVRKVLFLR